MSPIRRLARAIAEELDRRPGPRPTTVLLLKLEQLERAGALFFQEQARLAATFRADTASRLARIEALLIELSKESEAARVTITTSPPSEQPNP